MSNHEESTIEKEIRKNSEFQNPYSEECPNRHLWSEGYQIGAKIKSDDFKGLEILCIQKVWAVITMFEENNMPKAAKMLRDNI
jgi:hypothetical protein